MTESEAWDQLAALNGRFAEAPYARVDGEFWMMLHREKSGLPFARVGVVGRKKVRWRVASEERRWETSDWASLEDLLSWVEAM